jgi:tRNA (mo5U34)-methyltransferase
MPGVDERTLAERVASFEMWIYEFDLRGLKTPIFRPEHVNRHEQRRRYFFDPLVKLCGDSLAGKRILDLGCNAGWWSLLALEAGAEHVHGIDGRREWIEQAELVMEAKQVDPTRFTFEVRNVFDFDRPAAYDIVFCLGLLYHVNRHFVLMERMSEWTKDLIVVDTKLSRLPTSALEARYEPTEEPRSSVDYELVMRPTRRMLTDLARSCGLDMVTLKPRFTDWTGAIDYRRGLRRAAFFSKSTPLVGLDVEAGEPRRVADGLFWLGQEILRALPPRRHRFRRELGAG